MKRNDQFHKMAVAQYDDLVARRARLFTTSDVVSEAATRLRYDAGLAAALRFRDAIDSSRQAGRLRVVWIDERAHAEGWRILERYPDLELSLTDAVSAAVARNHRIREVFGFDEDFSALGFTVVPTR